MPAPLPSAVFVRMTSHENGTTPAKAGAQLGTVTLAGAALRYRDLSNWTPASAGVVPLGVRVAHTGMAHAGLAAMEGHA